MQCPACGREVEELAGGLCGICRSQRGEFLSMPESIDVVRCAHCGNVQRGEIWVDEGPDQRLATQAVLAGLVELDPELVDPHVDHEFDWEDERNATVATTLTARVSGQPIERTARTRVRLKAGACPDCSRRFGGYFEAILQVRSAESSPSKEELPAMGRWIQERVDRFAGEGRKGAYFSRSLKVRGGFDYYVGSQEIARILGRELSDHWGAEYGESSKLVGRKDGADLHRITILVRLPAYGPGDFIDLEGRPFKVLAFERKRVLLWSLDRNERIQREPRRLGKVRRIGGPADERDAVVVSHHRAQLQLLDPITLKTVELEAPGLGVGTGDVRVFRWNERLYLVPPEARAHYTRQ